MFNHFVQLVAGASGWAYGIVFALALLDALLPVVPSETVVITAGVVAAAGGLNLPLVMLSAACGAFAGDNLAYLIGFRFGARVANRFLRGEKGQRSLRWAAAQLSERGGELIVVARFIPGGRTAITLSAGTVRFPWPRFAVFDAIAGLIWGAYASLLGFFGGKTFEGAAWKGLIVALVIAFALTGGIELVRWLLKRRRSGGDDAHGRSQPAGARRR
jgi:membrane-associated protein